MRRHLLIIIILLTACASGPPPADLLDAENKLAAPVTAALEDEHPRLVAEARSYATRARRAYTLGDEREAEILGLLARQHYDIAVHLDAEGSARKRKALLTEHVAQLDNQEAQVQQEIEELRTLSRSRAEAEARVRDFESADPLLRKELEAALAALDYAHNQQLEAITVGAPSVAPTPYTLGREALTRAQDALVRLDAKGARAEALEAAQHFEEATRASQSSDIAMRRALTDPNNAMVVADRERVAAKAEELDEARKAALADAKRDNPNAVVITEVPTDTEPDTASATNPPAEAAPEGPSLDEARAAIDAAEAQRIELSSRSLEGDPRLAQGDFALQLAREAFAAGDAGRALTRANDARERFDALLAIETPTEVAQAEPQRTAPTEATPPTNTAPATRAETAPYVATTGGSNNTELTSLTKRILLELQLQRAEALGNGQDARCPNAFREFGSLLDLAQAQLNIGDTATAFELAIRAQERFKKCGQSPATRSRTASPPAAAQTAAPEESRAQRKAREKAAEDLRQAQEKYALLQPQATAREALTQSASLIALAERWYGDADYNQTSELAGRALSTLTTLEQTLAQEAEAATQRAQALDALRADIAATQTELAAAARATPPNDSRLNEATLLLRSAESWLAQGRVDEARPQLEQARKQIATILKAPMAQTELPKTEPVKTEPVKTEPAKTEPTQINIKVDQRSPNNTTPPIPVVATSTSNTNTEAPQNPCREISPLLEQATVAQSRVARESLSPVDEQRYQRALGNLAQARSLADRQCDIAMIFASDARAAFQELSAAPGGKTSSSNAGDEPLEARSRAIEAIAHAEVKQAQVESRSQSELYKTGFTLLERARKRLEAKDPAEAEKLAEQAAFAFSNLAGGDEPWSEPYNAVIDALILRDSARALLGEREEPRFDAGLEHLARSQRSWDEGNLPAAQRFAEEASKAFQNILDDAALREAAAREREQTLKLEEAKRREALLKKEAAALESERAAEADQKERDAAAKAKAEAETRAATAAKKEREAQKAEAAQEADRLAAESELREAEILAELCARERCEARAVEPFTRAERELADARRYLQEQNYEMTRRLARSALVEYQTALDARAVFTFPEGLTRVRLEGDRLILDPRITFERDADTLTPEATASVDELATLLTSNSDITFELRLVGYTDSRGRRTDNKVLSARRAEAVRTALIARGVDGIRIVAEGQGEANPVASNDSKAGRETNRRVELFLTLPEEARP